MLAPDDMVRLQHMLDYAVEAIDLMQGKTRSNLDQDRLLQLGMVRLIELIGEAASRVTKETQDRHEQIPWPQIVSMRNRLIHGYDFVDYDILWQTVQEDLPELVAKLKLVFRTTEQSEGNLDGK
ncbi:MAG: DUF86 domain-containing protein [bacterium]|nr:DUF86 domain-containing protein [bacterium]